MTVNVQKVEILNPDPGFEPRIRNLDQKSQNGWKCLEMTANGQKVENFHVGDCSAVDIVWRARVCNL